MHALFACSGVGGMVLIYTHLGYSLHMWYATLGITACSLLLWVRRRDRKRLVLPSVFLSAFHPAWTISPFYGDCGYMLFDASRIALGIVLVMLVVQIAVYIRTEGGVA